MRISLYCHCSGLKPKDKAHDFVAITKGKEQVFVDSYYNGQKTSSWHHCKGEEGQKRFWCYCKSGGQKSDSERDFFTRVGWPVGYRPFKIIKWSIYEKTLSWIRGRCSASIEDHVQKLCNCDTIVGKICNQLFSLRWKFGQCAMRCMLCAIHCNNHVRKRAMRCYYVKE